MASVRWCFTTSGVTSREAMLDGNLVHSAVTCPYGLLGTALKHIDVYQPLNDRGTVEFDCAYVCGVLGNSPFSCKQKE
jgi:hypothetical protein